MACSANSSGVRSVPLPTGTVPDHHRAHRTGSRSVRVESGKAEISARIVPPRDRDESVLYSARWSAPACSDADPGVGPSMEFHQVTIRRFPRAQGGTAPKERGADARFANRTERNGRGMGSAGFEPAIFAV